jgi:hypothetical protein
MKKFLINNWLFLILILTLGLIIWPVFMPGYFSHHDDLQVMRIYEMRRCLEDLQIPCRWVAEMGYGNGYPLFNFYSNLPYYIGVPFSYFLGYINAAKLLFAIPLILGFFSMYLFIKELWGKIPAYVAATLFMFAPYRALDSYVRGAVAESFAIALVPFVFYSLLLLMRRYSYKNLLLTAFSFFLFLICHNIMTMFFVPIIVLWLVLMIFLQKPKNIFYPFVGLLLGFGLAAYFLLPAYFEQSLVQVDTLTQGGTDFRAHFVTFGQLFFDRSWGYGASVFGPKDTISFQIGWPLWWIVLVVPLILLLQRLFKSNPLLEKSDRKKVLIFIFFALIFLLSIFMMHNKSAFIWEKIRSLQFSQFPWRFLSLSIFAASLIGGLLISLIKDKFKIYFALVIIAATIFLNWSFFRPAAFYYDLTDQEKLNGILWDFQQKAGILDYLPKTASEPMGPAPQDPIIISGEVKIDNYKKLSNRWFFQADVTKPTVIEMPVFYFPKWQVEANNQEIPYSYNNRLGRVSFNLMPGTYNIIGVLKDTPIRSLSNVLSLLSFFILITIPFKGRFKKI